MAGAVKEKLTKITHSRISTKNTTILHCMQGSRNRIIHSGSGRIVTVL
jgi:hypothetical protein